MALPILSTPSRSERPPAASSLAGQAGPDRLIDSHGRTIRDLRLSITDRCNYRCIYCMDPDFRYMPKRELLRLEEYIAAARACVSLGVDKLRITGGEPTLYPDLLPLIRSLSALTGVRDLAMTTNGSLMDDDAAMSWREAGLRRVTLSLDSVRSDRIGRITRSSATVDRTITAIRAAHRAGLTPVKVNAVIMRGVNDDEVAGPGGFADFAREHDVHVRLIEFMPLDSSRSWRREDVVTADEMLNHISERHALTPVNGDRADTTSLNYRFADAAPGSIGIIAPVSRPFCGACSRLRITADGKVRPCLFSRDEWDLRPLLRVPRHPHGRADDDAIRRFLVDAVWTKQAGHGISSPQFVQPKRTMSAIGG
jgi:GTP 3',8-cyclase